MNLALLIAQTPSPSPNVTRTIFTPPSAGGGEAFVAIVAIVLALAAGVVGFSIIRGGRGL